MMQPILDYRAAEFLDMFKAHLETLSVNEVAQIGELHFDVDTEFGANPDGSDDPLDKDDILAVIEGRLLDVFCDSGLAKFSYVDYDWAKTEGLVP